MEKLFALRIQFIMELAEKERAKTELFADCTHDCGCPALTNKLGKTKHA